MFPQYEDITADKISTNEKRYFENIADYLYDYDECYVSLMKYFWDSFSTLILKLFEKTFEKFIDHSNKERNM